MSRGLEEISHLYLTGHEKDPTPAVLPAHETTHGGHKTSLLFIYNNAQPLAGGYLLTALLAAFFVHHKKTIALINTGPRERFNLLVSQRIPDDTSNKKSVHIFHHSIQGQSTFNDTILHAHLQKISGDEDQCMIWYAHNQPLPPMQWPHASYITISSPKEQSKQVHNNSGHQNAAHIDITVQAIYQQQAQLFTLSIPYHELTRSNALCNGLAWNPKATQPTLHKWFDTLTTHITGLHCYLSAHNVQKLIALHSLQATTEWHEYNEVSG